MKDTRVNPDGSITVGILEDVKAEKPEEKKPTKKKKAVKK